MKLLLYNKLTKKNYEITNFKEMKMYVCGPTLYDKLHIGNGRSLIIFDVFYRFFTHIFEKVTYVRNITDIEDKIVKKSLEQQVTTKQLVEGYEVFFRKDLEYMNVLPPNYEPKATEFLPQMFSYIEKLLVNKFAYITAEKNIYFRVDKLPNYDFFQNIDALKEDNRVMNKEDKENWKDFALWKSVTDNCGYESPWGYGRPGWHLECSVMSNHYLGNKFLFHGGGEDLAFPHHHNEIAQGLGFCGDYCSEIFVHNGLICLNGHKMSKSLGNIINIQDLVKNKYDGDVLRYIYISTYYSSNVNYSQEILDNSRNIINKLREFKFKNLHLENLSQKECYLPSLLNGMNIPETLNHLFALMESIENYQLVMNTFKLLGFDLAIRTSINVHEIQTLIEERNVAKKNQNYQLSDVIRQQLLDHFVKIEDTKNGQVWFYI